MWMWDGWGNMTEVEAPNRADKALVGAGLAASVAEATRLVKGNGVRILPSLY